MTLNDCPFNFLTQFRDWMEWQKRVQYRREHPVAVSDDMIGLSRRVQKKIEQQIMTAPNGPLGSIDPTIFAANRSTTRSRLVVS